MDSNYYISRPYLHKLFGRLFGLKHNFESTLQSVYLNVLFVRQLRKHVLYNMYRLLTKYDENYMRRFVPFSVNTRFT